MRISDDQAVGSSCLNQIRSTDDDFTREDHLNLSIRITKIVDPVDEETVTKLCEALNEFRLKTTWIVNWSGNGITWEEVP